LTVTLPPTPVYVHADLTRLAQVFWNLLSNSAKYTDPNGRIDVSARCDETEVVISVRDNGIGIPPESRDKLFTMFSQLDHSLERSQGGLGLGLALVKGLTEMHGGWVEVQSAGIGQGSEFAVHLPLNAAAVEGGEPNVGAPSAADRTERRRRILVVDDNRDAA